MKKSNGEGTIYYSESKKCYVGQIVIGRNAEGKPIRKTFYDKTKSKVHDKLVETQSDYNKGIYADDEGMLLYRWIDKWFSIYKINDFKEGTYEKEYRRSARIRNSYLGQMRLKDIKPLHIQQFINEISKDLSPKSVNNVKILLNGSFKQAVADGLILVNPCDRVSLPKIEKTEMVALDKRQKDIFLEVARSNPYYDIFLFALNTGLRISEICGLLRENIDFENGYITVDKQLVRLKGKTILESPKTITSIRQVPITPIARKILMKYMYGDYSDIKYVFYNPVNHKQLVQNTLSINCHKAFKKCYELTHEEVFEKANFHSLRHTFATQWIVQGGNVVLLSKVLGHSNPSFTMKVYVQPSNDDIKTEMLDMVF